MAITTGKITTLSLVLQQPIRYYIRRLSQVDKPMELIELSFKELENRI